MKRVIVLLILVALFVATYFVFRDLQHWLAIHTGSDNEQSPFYGWWSGFGASSSRSSSTSGSGLASMPSTDTTSARSAGASTSTRRRTPQNFCHRHYTHEHVEKHRDRHMLKFPNHIAHNPKPVTIRAEVLQEARTDV